MLRKTFAILIIAILLASYYVYPLSAPTNGADMEGRNTAYHIKIKMISQREFEVEEDIYVVNKGEQAVDKLLLQVFPKAFAQPSTSPIAAKSYPTGWSAGNLVVNEVTIGNQHVTPLFEGVLMVLPLNKPILPGNGKKIKVHFTLKVPKLNYRFGRYNGMVNLGDWYPVLVPSGREITVYPSVGDPANASVADYSLNLTIPQKYTAVTSGILIEEKNSLLGQKTLSYEGESLRSFAMVLGENLRIKRSRVGNTNIEYAFIDDQNADVVINTLKDTLSFYEESFGQYPYAKLTLVETYLSPFQGVEYPGLIMLASRVKDKEDTMQRIVAHEVAHQWWYGTVGNDQVREPWIDESIATYASKLFIEDRLNKDFNFGSDLAATARAGRIDFLSPVTAFESREEYLTHVYYGGAMFWTALQHQVGKQELVDFLKDIYIKYHLSEITTVQMQQEINRLVEQ